MPQAPPEHVRPSPQANPVRCALPYKPVLTQRPRGHSCRPYPAEFRHPGVHAVAPALPGCGSPRTRWGRSVLLFPARARPRAGQKPRAGLFPAHRQPGQTALKEYPARQSEKCPHPRWLSILVRSLPMRVCPTRQPQTNAATGLPGQWCRNRGPIDPSPELRQQFGRVLFRLGPSRHQTARLPHRSDTAM